MDELKSQTWASYMRQSNRKREIQDSDPGSWDCLHTRVCSCRKGMDTLTKHWLAYEFTENISSTNSHCTYLISGSLLEQVCHWAWMSLCCHLGHHLGLLMTRVFHAGFLGLWFCWAQLTTAQPNLSFLKHQACIWSLGYNASSSCLFHPWFLPIISLIQAVHGLVDRQFSHLCQTQIYR